MYKPTSGLSHLLQNLEKALGLLQILPSDWLSYSLSIGDRLLVVKGINFQIQNSIIFYNILSDYKIKTIKKFCLTIKLKQLKGQ